MTIAELITTIKSSPQHRHLYHFTDEANLVSISEKGLVSKSRMQSEGWWPPITTGGHKLSQQLDAEAGIDKYVSLCFTRNHPMLYIVRQEGRLPNAQYLGIQPEVLEREGVLISFGVANALSAIRQPVAKAIQALDVEVIYRWTDWSDPAIRQRLRAAEKFEVLVPDHVPRDLIVTTYGA